MSNRKGALSKTGRGRSFENQAKVFACSILIALVSVPVIAEELVNSFEEAAARGETLEKAPATKEYFSKTLMPYFGQRYAKVLQSCFATVPNPDNASFSFVAAFGSDGRTIRVYRDHETNIFRCVSDSLSKETFPAPPVVPYYLHIAMKFTDDPSADSKPVKSAPPLVLEPNKYSYTFGVPTGWEYSFEQAQEAGVRLLFFPKGGSFATSNSIVYANEANDDVCTASCTGMLARAIEKNIKESLDDSPMLQVANAKPIAIKGGGTATVRILTGWRSPLQVKEALAFIEHDEAIVLVVLTTKNVKSWEQDYSAFREIVAGHKFFNCNSPDLAAGCHP
jgi:hypothetical protein